MKRGKLTLVAVVLSGSLLFSSCVGLFGFFPHPACLPGINQLETSL